MHPGWWLLSDDLQLRPDKNCPRFFPRLLKQQVWLVQLECFFSWFDFKISRWLLDTYDGSYVVLIDTTIECRVEPTNSCLQFSN